MTNFHKKTGLSFLISNGMIIQRNSEFPIWTNQKISVLFSDKSYESRPENNKWLITLDPVPAGGHFSMEISSDDETCIIKDIFAGDLWLCSGQSNMEMQMSRLCDDYPGEWDYQGKGKREKGKGRKEFPVIRQFNVPQLWDFSGPREDLSGGKWICASAESLHEFTAAGWFFAKNLYQKYLEAEKQTVPIGLIYAAWGGTPVESWLSREALTMHNAQLTMRNEQLTMSNEQKSVCQRILADGEKYADAALRDEITERTSYAILEWETNVKNEDVGFALGWEKPETDISCWQEMNLPGGFYSASGDEELKNFCGSIWLAKDFKIDSNFAKNDAKAAIGGGKIISSRTPTVGRPAKIWLGTIIDADIVFVNGKEIGNTGYRYPPRKYVPAGLLKEGNNRIVIRVTCNNGQGGITCGKPFRIFTDSDSIELSGVWKYKIGAAAEKERPEEFFFHYQPMGCFNAMINPILKFPLKGVLWYQGESNESRANEYANLFQRMIIDWRTKNGNDSLPFLFVQLPIFLEPSDNCENHNWALMREAQSSALSLPHTGMAAAWEFGEWNDIHPINKKDAGYRLFLAAEKLLFGVGNTSPGAMVERWECLNNKLFIYFKNVGSGLQIQGSGDRGQGSVAVVSIINDEQQINLPIVIESSDCISIDLSNVKNPKKVLYAWANNPIHRNLYNSEGLPVLPFKIILCS